MQQALSGQQSAELLGVTTRRLYQLAKEADPPPKTHAGAYPAREYGAWLRRRWMAEAGVQADGQILDYEAERARLTKAQADKTELEIAQLRGKLIPTDLVIAAWQALIINAKTRLLGLGTKVAPLVIAATNLSEIEAAVKLIIHEALRELAGDGLPHGIDGLLVGRAGDVDAPTGPERKRVGRPPSETKSRKRGGTGTVDH